MARRRVYSILISLSPSFHGHVLMPSMKTRNNKHKTQGMLKNQIREESMEPWFILSASICKPTEIPRSELLTTQNHTKDKCTLNLIEYFCITLVIFISKQRTRFISQCLNSWTSSTNENEHESRESVIAGPTCGTPLVNPVNADVPIVNHTRSLTRVI